MNSPSMIFRSSLLRTAVRRATAAPEVASRQFSSVTTSKAKPASSFLGTWYSVFGSTTAGYAAWLALGIVFGEMLTGAGTDMVWRSANYGRTFDTVDWSKFDPKDDDEEDEEEEEDDDDDDDDE